MGIRDSLLRRRTEQVALPDGTAVTLRELSVAEFVAVYAAGEEDMKYALVSAAVMDDGGPALSAAECREVPRAIFETLFAAAMRLNKQEPIEAIQKN